MLAIKNDITPPKKLVCEFYLLCVKSPIGTPNKSKY